MLETRSAKRQRMTLDDSPIDEMTVLLTKCRHKPYVERYVGYLVKRHLNGVLDKALAVFLCEGILPFRQG